MHMVVVERTVVTSHANKQPIRVHKSTAIHDEQVTQQQLGSQNTAGSPMQTTGQSANQDSRGDERAHLQQHAATTVSINIQLPEMENWGTRVKIPVQVRCCQLTLLLCSLS